VIGWGWGRVSGFIFGGRFGDSEEEGGSRNTCGVLTEYSGSYCRLGAEG
jgi:hypothetical protein